MLSSLSSRSPFYNHASRGNENGLWTIVGVYILHAAPANWCTGTIWSACPTFRCGLGWTKYVHFHSVCCLANIQFGYRLLRRYMNIVIWVNIVSIILYRNTKGISMDSPSCLIMCGVLSLVRRSFSLNELWMGGGRGDYPGYQRHQHGFVIRSDNARGVISNPKLIFPQRAMDGGWAWRFSRLVIWVNVLMFMSKLQQGFTIPSDNAQRIISNTKLAFFYQTENQRKILERITLKIPSGPVPPMTPDPCSSTNLDQETRDWSRIQSPRSPLPQEFEPEALNPSLSPSPTSNGVPVSKPWTEEG